jgi:hypothetical protein
VDQIEVDGGPDRGNGGLDRGNGGLDRGNGGPDRGPQSTTDRGPLFN